MPKEIRIKCWGVPDVIDITGIPKGYKIIFHEYDTGGLCVEDIDIDEDGRECMMLNWPEHVNPAMIESYLRQAD